MEPAQPPFFSEWTSAIHSRLLTQWEAWKNQDAAANDAVIMEDFRAFCPDGTLRGGGSSAQQMAEQPIAGYRLSEFRVVPVAAEAALVTYFAEIEAPDSVRHHMAVGEFWILRQEEWFIRGFSGTLMR
ncbi:MAG: nuclear transport factor 2 family protein [Terracidiphilus sp.]